MLLESLSAGALLSRFVADGLVLELVTDLLNYFEFLVVAPKEDVIEDLAGLRSKLWVRLDHHHDHVLELLGTLLNEVRCHLLQIKLTS